MFTSKPFVSIFVAANLAISGLALADVKTYQVTGPVLEVTDTSITVQKGQDRWQIARDANTKVTGELKVGTKVTIEYTMTAATVEVKGGGKEEKPAKGGDKKDAPKKTK